MTQSTTNSKLVTFMYLLMRDHLPAGTIEQIIVDIDKQESFILSNGYLGQYAEDIEKRLTSLV